MAEDSHPLNHADRCQIVFHEIRSSQVQNVQIADRVELFLRSMQPGNWSGAFRDMSAVAAQVHRVAQAGLFDGFRDRVALSLLVFPGGNRRQHQERESDAIAKAVKESGLRYAVNL